MSIAITKKLNKDYKEDLQQKPIIENFKKILKS